MKTFNKTTRLNKIKMPKKIEQPIDPLEARLCLLEFTCDDLVNELVSFKQELKLVKEKQTETDKIVKHLKESIQMIKSDEITDINSFRKIKQDYNDFKIVLNNQNILIETLNKQIKNHQKDLSNTMKELEQVREKMSKRENKILEFKIK
jgi:uncharacterized coiled-coil protein SlyX